MAHRITRREVRIIYEALADFHDKHNHRPTKSDLRGHYGFTRTQLRAAERKGYIESRYRETERGRVNEWCVPAFRPMARFWWWVVRVRRWFRRVFRPDTFYGAKKRKSCRGRIKGLGCTPLKQRRAVLNKDVLTQEDEDNATR